MPFTPQQALQRAIEHREIFFDEMVDLMRQVMRGEAAAAVRIHPPGALLHASRWVDAGRMRQNRVWRRSR